MVDGAYIEKTKDFPTKLPGLKTWQPEYVILYLSYLSARTTCKTRVSFIAVDILITLPRWVAGINAKCDRSQIALAEYWASQASDDFDLGWRILTKGAGERYAIIRAAMSTDESPQVIPFRCLFHAYGTT